MSPADIPEETASRMMELTVKAFRALKLNVYSRADFLLDEKGNLYCLEMNTLPGMTAASLLPKEAKAAGIEYGDLCEMIIKKFAIKFLDDSSFQNLKDALAGKNLDDSFRAAHTLKGVCVNLGFDKLYEASSKLTEQLRAGKLEGCDEMFKDVEKEYEMTISVLKEFAEQN